MKRLVFAILFPILFNSCVSSYYYQIVETRPSAGIKIGDGYMIYEDENINIIYNFWKKYGEAGFVMYNKSSENVYLHLDECFLVSNGMAYDYYKNRVWSNDYNGYESYQRSLPTNVSNSIKVTNSNESCNFGLIIYDYNKYVDAKNDGLTGELTTKSVLALEKRIVCVPPQSSKFISEYNICNSVIRLEELNLNPRRRGKHSLDFSRDNTPITFENRIVYSVGDNKCLNRVVNKFYITKISNYLENECTEKDFDRKNNDKNIHEVKRTFKEHRANMFYIPYKLKKYPNESK